MKEVLLIESGIEIAHIEWTHITSYQDFFVHLNGDIIISGHFRISGSEKQICMTQFFNVTIGSCHQSTAEIDLYCALLKAVTKSCENRKEQLKTMDL